MKNSEKRRNMRKKLMAALCMLLVSTTLLATTSYAWLILSTAPEVKGMQTTVGANGGLEIALLGSRDSLIDPDDPDVITAYEGDSSSLFGNSALTSNITWGNIVDLSDDAYGLNMIKLLPAKLDLDDAGKLSQSLLSMPLYGTDGRVSETSNAYTNSSTFNENSMTFATPTGDHYMLGFPLEYGVRGVGLSTNKTTRETAYDTGLASGSSYGNTFRQAAITSLNTSGKDLINIAVMYANGDASYTYNEVKALWDVVDAILGTTRDDGTTVTGMIDTATQAATYYQIAAFASKLNEVEYEDDAAFQNALTTEAATFQNEAVIELGTKIALLKTAAEEARTKLNALGKNRGTEYTYAEVSPVLDLLFSNMDLWGKSVEELKAMERMELVTLVTQNGMRLPANVKGGAYSIMADICGDFATQTSVSVVGFSLGTTLTIKHQAANIALSNCANSIAVGAGKLATSSGSVVISDTYAYVVDMAFRTNAEESNLQLQTAATQRFTSSNNETTMGGGSTITFTSTDEDFLAKRMLRLMDKIRLVFFVPAASGGQEIIKYARLDTTNPIIDGLNPAQGTPGEEGYVPADEGYAEAMVNGRSITANVYLLDDENNMITDQTNASIIDLEFEKAQVLSVLVYLDGRNITNMDVATGSMSMTGSLNLQFSSSAPLTSMDYSAELGPANDSNTTIYDVESYVFDDVDDGTAIINVDGSVIRKQPLTFTVEQKPAAQLDENGKRVYQALSIGYTVNKQDVSPDSDGELIGELDASNFVEKEYTDAEGAGTGEFYREYTVTIPADQVTGHMGIIVEALKYKVNFNTTNAPEVQYTVTADGVNSRYLANRDVVFAVANTEDFKVYIDGELATAVDGKYTIEKLGKNTSVKFSALHDVTYYIDGVHSELFENEVEQGVAYEVDMPSSGDWVVEYKVGNGEPKELSAFTNYTISGSELTDDMTVNIIPAVTVAQTASASVTGVETTAKLVRTDKDYVFSFNSDYVVLKKEGTDTNNVNPADFTKLNGTDGTYTIPAADLTDMTLYVTKEFTVDFTGTVGDSMEDQTVYEGVTITIPTNNLYTVKVNGNDFTGNSITVTGDMTVEINTATP